MRAAASVPSTAKAPEEQYYAHVAADMLAPGTTYYYSVGHQGLDPNSGDLAQRPISSFTTAPLRPGPFTFTAFGDQGTSCDAVSTTNLLLAQSPAFHLHAGDVSYAEDGGNGLLTDSYDPRAWDSYFVQAASTAAFIPWMVSLGNHEMEPWYSPDGYGDDVNRFDFPGNGPAVCPGTYTFTYGNVGFISLDPNDVSYEIPANLGYSKGSQTTWLGQTLAALRANRTIDFIVVFFHHCAYCTCTSHGSEGGVRQYWTPLFDHTAWISSSMVTTTSMSGPIPSRRVHRRPRRRSDLRLRRRPRARPTSRQAVPARASMRSVLPIVTKARSTMCLP
jgi:hypothetical protein